MAAFEEMGVLSQIAKRLEELEWLLPTDIQAEAIPLILGGGDVLMAAETGSGKTGAFCIPILQSVWETIKDIQCGKLSHASKSTDSTQSETWMLNPYDRSTATAVASEGMCCQSRDAQWNGIRATKGVINEGKYYFEASVSDEGLCRIGWSLNEASLDLGTDRYGFGFGGTGKKSNNKCFDDYGEPYGFKDVVGCALDLDNMIVSFSKNGKDLGKAFDLPLDFKKKGLFPAVVLKNAEVNLNFGSRPFQFCPRGFVAVSHAPHSCTVDNANTAAFAPVGPVKPQKNAPQAVILEPSRELAEQTWNELRNFVKYLDSPSIHFLLATGGVPVKQQLNDLQIGADIVVGTPGRVEELIKNGNIVLTNCRFIVLDEADGLLQQGHGEMINRLHGRTPKVTSDGKPLQMIVCSATLHSFDVKKMAEHLMRFPTWVDLKGEDSVPDTVHHAVVLVDPLTDLSWQSFSNRILTDGVHGQDRVIQHLDTREQSSQAVKWLKGEYCVRAIRKHQMDHAIIFCRTKLDCDNLEVYLNSCDKHMFSCVCLHGDRKPQERRESLDAFKQKKVKFLICTDVAARGLDISGLPFMINFTLPDEPSSYVHRIGRVGRAERMGLAISLVSTVQEKVWYHGNWCSSRGKGCMNNNLVSGGGCCIWYDEMQCLRDIELHLGVTIPLLGTDMAVPIDDFDGKVTYGQKRKTTASPYENHVSQMTGAVQELAVQEMKVQSLFHLFPSSVKKMLEGHV